MKTFVVLLATILAANVGSLRIVRQAGGWNSFSSPPQSATLTDIALDAALAAVGSGSASENHADNVQVVGGGELGPNGELVISSFGFSEIDQEGHNFEVTSQDAQSASSLNLVFASQLAGGAEQQSLDALGLSIVNEQSGSAMGVGEGASAVAVDSYIQVLPVTAVLGIGKP